MNLHQASKKPDWEKIEFGQKLNVWQRAAAKTGGIASLANFVTLAGLTLTISGVNDVKRGHVTRGFIKMVAGGSSDKLDGLVAERFGLKSPLGEVVDTGADKVGVGYSLLALTRAGVVPPVESGLLVVQNGANIAISAVAKKHEVELHPSASGKWAMGLQRSGIGLHILSAALRENERSNAAKFCEYGARAVTGAALVLGAVATVGYAKETFQHSPLEAPVSAPPTD